MSISEKQHLQQLNLQRESWCMVEPNPRQAWDRPQRRHYCSHLQTSPILLGALTAGQPRPVARVERRPPTKRPERRHFEGSNKSQSVWTSSS